MSLSQPVNGLNIIETFADNLETKGLLLTKGVGLTKQTQAIQITQATKTAQTTQQIQIQKQKQKQQQPLGQEKDQDSATESANFFNTDDCILIIGGTGSLGVAIIKQLLRKGVRICVISRDENKQWQLKLLFPTVEFYLGCMRDYERLKTCVFKIKPTYVIIAGALKHIDQCESNPSESIQTNLDGVQNVLRACSDYIDRFSDTWKFRKNGCFDVDVDANVDGTTTKHKKMKTLHKALEAVLLVSTDKACSPVNVYGMCKALAERMVTECAFRETMRKNQSFDSKQTRFLCTRYGNVLNSRGSILPKLKEMALNPKVTAFPLTDKNMTRFFMSLNESVELIFSALEHGVNGETWIPDIPSFRVADVIAYFSKKYKKTIDIVGIRPGEKVHEMLINECEMPRAHFYFHNKKGFYALQPILMSKPKESKILLDAVAKRNLMLDPSKKEFTSERTLSEDALQTLLDIHA